MLQYSLHSAASLYRFSRKRITSYGNAGTGRSLTSTFHLSAFLFDESAAIYSEKTFLASTSSLLTAMSSNELNTCVMCTSARDGSTSLETPSPPEKPTNLWCFHSCGQMFVAARVPAQVSSMSSIAGRIWTTELS